MQKRVSELRSWLLVAAVATLSCGGKSESREADRENEAGADAGGSAGSGGSVASGGRSGAGGSNSSAGGASGQGGSSAGGGSSVGGSAGAPPDDGCTRATPSFRACDGPPVYFHDVTTGECLRAPPQFCPDDDKPTFATLAECLRTCSGARPASSACDVASDCIVAAPGCCGGCEPVTQEQLKAVHRDRRDALGNDCDVACGPCPEVTEIERTGQYFVPACDAGTCSVRDLRSTSATECDSDDDCRLRDGAGCCEGCDGLGLVAISSTELLYEACPEEIACDACVPPESEDYEAACSAEGRCVVRHDLNNSDGRLISGDPERCPPSSSASNVVCNEPPDSSCIYAGGQFGSSTLAGALACFCDEDSPSTKQWICLATDLDGNSPCPRSYPPPGPCSPGPECDYGVGVAVANCYCYTDESPEGEFMCFL